MIDDLMFAQDGDTGEDIVARHQKEQAEEEEQAKKMAMAAPVYSAKGGRDVNVAAAVAAGVADTSNIAGERYFYRAPEYHTLGPSAPSASTAELDSFTAHMRSATDSERASGYSERLPCVRALREAMSGLFFDWS